MVDPPLIGSRSKALSDAPSLDPALLASLTEVFRAEAAERVPVLRQLFADLAGKQGNPDEILKSAKREAHNLKGSAATVGAMDAHGWAQRLEKQIVGVSGGASFPSPIALAAMNGILEELAKSAGAPPL